MPRIPTSLAAKRIRSKKRGIKNLLQININSEENKKIENLFPKLDSLRQDGASQVYNSNLNMNDMLIKDKNTQRALKDLYERDKRGRKPTGRGYVAKKIKKDEEYTGPGKYKKGGSVKAKCKLGRNKPTKLY